MGGGGRDFRPVSPCTRRSYGKDISARMGRQLSVGGTAVLRLPPSRQRARRTPGGTRTVTSDPLALTPQSLATASTIARPRPAVSHGEGDLSCDRLTAPAWVTWIRTTCLSRTRHRSLILPGTPAIGRGWACRYRVTHQLTYQKRILASQRCRRTARGAASPPQRWSRSSESTAVRSCPDLLVGESRPSASYRRCAVRRLLIEWR
jgi:hypothetical protein